MPELPEVEGVVRTLRPQVIARTIVTCIISETVIKSKEIGKEAIIKQLPVDVFMNMMQGQTIREVRRRSKYIYFTIEKDGMESLLVSHLGMSGAWFVIRTIEEIPDEKFRKHIHAWFELNTGEWLVYSDIRRFGELRLLKQESDHPPLLAMAPEPFDSAALSHFLSYCQTTRGKEKPIKEVIMDGKILSGCGNIYATEALFRCHIHPNRSVKRISNERLTELFKAIVKVLQESIDAGGSSISDYRNSNGEAGNMQNQLQMYGKDECPICQVSTKKIMIAGRTSVYCPKCQH